MTFVAIATPVLTLPKQSLQTACERCQSDAMKEHCHINFTSKYSWEIVGLRILSNFGLGPVAYV